MISQLDTLAKQWYFELKPECVGDWFDWLNSICPNWKEIRVDIHDELLNKEIETMPWEMKTALRELALNAFKNWATKVYFYSTQWELGRAKIVCVDNWNGIADDKLKEINAKLINLEAIDSTTDWWTWLWLNQIKQTLNAMRCWTLWIWNSTFDWYWWAMVEIEFDPN